MKAELAELISDYKSLAESKGVPLHHMAAHCRCKVLWMHVWGGPEGDYQKHFDEIDKRLLPSGRAARFAMRNGKDVKAEYIEHVIRTQAKWFTGKEVKIRVLGKEIILNEKSIEKAQWRTNP